PLFGAATLVELELMSCISGSGRNPVTAKGAKAGPEARTRSVWGPAVPVPPTTKPAIRALLPVPAFARHERLTSRPGSVVVTTASAAEFAETPRGLVARQS